MDWMTRTINAFVRVPVLAFALCTGAVALVSAAPAFAAPAIDGNIDDMVAFAQSLESSDDGCGLYLTDKPDLNGNPTPETIYNDLKFIPCPQPQPALGQHWVNGVEIFYHVLAYEHGSSTMYLGLRSEGFIGDGDGNGNPDNSGGTTCNPKDNIEDTLGISGNELYAWSFDLDCNGSTDGTIKVQDNVVSGTGTLAGATGTIAFRQGGSASGHDLEVQVNLPAPMPAAFSFLRVEANAFDGLSEDRSDGGVCIGNPEIAVQKSATPTAVCPGQNSRFTITVQNTGQTPLSVVVVDQLPAQLSYAGGLNSSCNVGAPVVNGQQLTFPAFTLAAETNCTISFDVTASAQCAGPQNNVVDVTGTFTSACIEEPGNSITRTAHAEFAITCQAPPCVQVTATGPESACPGAPVTISGTATNCSPSAETIVVRVNGVQAFSNTVAAGATVNWSLDTTMPAGCTAGQNSSFVVEAVATGDCGTDTEASTVLVRCKDQPCLELTSNREPASACPGANVTISGTVRNCSLDPETIVVTVDGVQAFSQVVAPGATANWSRQVVMPACTAGQSVSFPIVATATGDCPPAATQNQSVSVLCLGGPCVELTANREPASACPGDPITISGSVRNCSLAPETIVVTVNGQQVFSQVVAAGATAQYSQNFTMPQCTAGQNVDYVVLATATGDCPPAATDTETVSVACKNPPCVLLTNVQANKASACPNEPVVVSGRIQNCGTDAANYTVTVEGVQVFSGQLAPGAEQTFQREVSMGACVAGNNVTFAVVANASNSCGTDTENASASVRCKAAPCVELTANRNPESACPGDAVTISGTVRNCSLDPENIVVTVNGEQVFSGVVQPGQTQQYSKATVMPQCTAGQSVPWTIVAVATNDCDQVGQRQETTVSVQCKNPPCVQLVDVRANRTDACPNEPITVSGRVRNCGTDAATYVVTVGGVQVFSGTIQPGAEQSFSRDVNMGACTAGNSVVWAVQATATNSCGTASADAEASVRCKGQPCVELTASGPPSSCTGENITIQGTVRNCSQDPETIVVTVDGVQAFSGTVAGGATANWSRTVPMKQCSAGQSVSYAVSATATNDCGTDTESATVNVACLAEPCVNVSLNAPASACVGVQVQLCGSVTNCSGGPETIEVRYADQVERFENVEAGGSRNYCFDVVMPACPTSGVRDWTVTAVATNSCGTTQQTATDATKCEQPLIRVTKSAESLVTDGEIIHYTITVENPGDVDLQNVVVTDTPCSYSVYNDHADPAPFSEPAVGGTGQVVWHIALLEAGGSRTFRFEAKASLSSGGASCPGEVVCTNRVDVVGYCAGSDNSTPVRDDDEVDTTIRCLVFNCPRTPGFWTQQCAQKSGGSTKFNVSQMNAITARIDDVSSFFNWSSDFASFCAIIDPPKPMTQQRQAKRQFAVLLANYATDLLDLTPSNGNKLLLDPSTPISCSGFKADTIGELIEEIDDLLIALEGGSSSAAGYSDIISCVDDINNGRTIPTVAGCEHGDGSVPVANGTGTGAGAGAGAELYHAAPNPFSSSTQFAYEVTGDQASVDITVFNVAGRQVRKLVGTTQPAGRYTATWDGKSDDGVSVTRGVYFVRTIIAGSKAPVQRLLYIRDGQ